MANCDAVDQNGWNRLYGNRLYHYVISVLGGGFSQIPDFAAGGNTPVRGSDGHHGTAAPTAKSGMIDRMTPCLDVMDIPTISANCGDKNCR